MAEAKKIIRIAGKDIEGNKKIKRAFKEIKGIGRNLSRSIATTLVEETKKDIDMNTKVGELTEEEIKKAEEIIENPEKYGIPGYLLNRRKDRKTGKNKHLIGSKLDLQRKREIGFMSKIKCYKGMRHRHGLRVRGQRTKTTGRGGLELGVKVKKRDLKK